jgi:hypothetical protein
LNSNEFLSKSQWARLGTKTFLASLFSNIIINIRNAINNLGAIGEERETADISSSQHPQQRHQSNLIQE